MVILTQEEHARVSRAIKQAEQATSGEIFCVLSRRSDSYFLAAGFVLACAVMITTFIISWLSYFNWYDFDAYVFPGVQIAAFALSLLVIWFWPSLRLRLVPKSLCYRRAHSNAVRQFLAHNIHATADRTGIVIFISLAERYAEILADSGISSKIEQAEWNRIVATMTETVSRGQIADALIEAVQQSGSLLVTHFPAPSGNRNELPDHVIEI
jgi:putative membrane protein